MPFPENKIWVVWIMATTPIVNRTCDTRKPADDHGEIYREHGSIQRA